MSYKKDRLYICKNCNNYYGRSDVDQLKAMVADPKVKAIIKTCSKCIKRGHRRK